MSDREDNEAFERWWNSDDAQAWDMDGKLIHDCEINYGCCKATHKAAWQAAITECQAICGNQYDFLKDAMEKLK